MNFQDMLYQDENYSTRTPMRKRAEEGDKPAKGRKPKREDYKSQRQQKRGFGDE